jgi:hypothetical protein
VTDDEDLKAIEARAQAATPGPWRNENPAVRTGPEDCQTLVAFAYDLRQQGQNAAFIAAARTDVPKLVAEVRRLRAALEAASDDLHGEFCSSRHHLTCQRVRDALGLDAPQGSAPPDGAGAG